jgi:hypothetical protein
MANKAKKTSLKDLKDSIKEIQYARDKTKAILKYNARILGKQNYYRFATHITADLRDIGYVINHILYQRLKDAKINFKDKRYRRIYKDYKYKTWSINGITLFTIQACKFKIPMQCTIEGYKPEAKKSKSIKPKTNLYNDIEKLYDKVSNGEKCDTKWEIRRIETYERDKGRCQITNEYLNFKEFDIHHIIPKENGGTDDIDNLITIKKDVHIELHKEITNTVLSQNYPKFDEFRKIILNN